MDIRNKLVNIGDYFYYRKLQEELSEMKTVLDVGCGDSSPLRKVRKTFFSMGVDVHRDSITKSRKLKIHDAYKICDVLTIDKLFEPKSFDAVIALDVVEHFEKKDGLKLIKVMEGIAKKKVIIFTPFGFTQQHVYDNNLYQEHKSGWYIRDFEKMGYKIYGMRGFRFVRGEYATIKYRPWLFWGAISTISQFLVYNYPKFAYQLLAVKKM